MKGKSGNAIGMAGQLDRAIGRALQVVEEERPVLGDDEAPATGPKRQRARRGDPPVAVVTDGSIKMEARLSHPYIGTGSSDVFATIDLTGVQVPGATRSPVNVALVIDRSGSMAGEKLAQAKQAARKLVEQLGEQDRIAIVHFGSEVRRFEGTWATPSNKERMLSYIDGIYDAIRNAGLALPERPRAADLDGRVVNCFMKCEADRRGTLRGRRQIMLDDSDVHHHRHSKAAVGGVAAAAIGDPAVFVSVDAMHQGPHGGGPVIAIVRVPDDG